MDVKKFSKLNKKLFYTLLFGVMFLIFLTYYGTSIQICKDKLSIQKLTFFKFKIDVFGTSY